MNADFFYGSTASDVFERIKLVLGVKTSKELSFKTGMSESGISSAIKRNSIPYAFCADLSLSTGVPVDWLLFGDVDGDNHYRAIDPNYFNKAYLKADFVTQTGKFIESPIINSDTSNTTPVPLYDTPASAGNGSFFDTENIIQYVPFDTAWLKQEGLNQKNLVCLPIKGDSMQPGLIDGDIVLVNRAAQQGDGVFVLRIGDALRIKRLQWLANGSLRISSDNPLYQPEILDPSQLDDSQFAIIGACHTKIGRVS